ncbi:hypothetical protein [Collinsella intestinalis]|uniref:hypothetical protein n=1 Tax=Collinsella intestinalis TaxID=147207 RepID=UPI0025A476D9|nr:hypothetical protein [Collinsella intestinalis]MDM8162613.1 hypothetical protein [Collinsella intestinalis]
MERREIVCRLGGIDPDEGVDVNSLVKYLRKFDDLVRVTVREAGYDGKLEIRVRPFREGSFITEFIVESGVVDFLTSQNVDAVLKGLEILGFCYGGAKGIPRVVRKVRGAVDRFKDNDDGSYTYGKGDDAVTVDKVAHQVIQNPTIAELYRDVAVGPVSEFNGAVQQVNIYIRDPDAADGGISEGASFAREDVSELDAYAKAAAAADELAIVETSYVNRGIWLRPLSGSYAGAERGYTFQFGVGDDTVTYKSVRIDDKVFLESLADGSVRFNAGDLLQADLEVTERRTKSGNKKKVSYRILEVIDYKPLETPRQETFDEYLESGEQ